ncbi:tetratricopeptide repeat-containing sulfotransferase family protein [Sphingomonas sp. GCM10030256]|uniref:tetratricopeptide repeat-containing sulfotransferase family protein n=1 Tax=Sphingomonas sp. GCM10030256 TaxID=3273427 RepID=UPI00361DE043
MSGLDPARRRLIEAALNRRDIAAAAELAEQALTDGARDPLVLNLAAWRREEHGDLAGAHALLLEALGLSPGDPLILGAIGAVLRKQGLLSEALRTLDQAIAVAPQNASFWLEKAMALDAGGSLSPALDSYQRAARLDPRSASAFGGGASIAARLGKAEVAVDLGEKALAIDPLQPMASAALARIALEQQDPAAALRRLKPLLSSTTTGTDNQSTIWSLAGDAFERLNRIEEAFSAYVRANAEAEHRFDRLLAATEERPDHRALAERLLREFDDVNPTVWAGGSEGEPGHRSPTFLIGYPRSGTTLVENILASNTGVDALEERPTLAAGDSYLKKPGGIAELAALDRAGVAAIRDGYWRAVAAAGSRSDAELLVDMDPLKGLKLPLIGRVFPAARIIVMRRDPRDVVWSCFRANFAPSPAALEFTDLERAAHHYAAVMAAQDRFLQLLPLNTLEVRYEELVEDFDSATKALCAFLEVPWTPALRDFAGTAAHRNVSTLSVTQVRRGLYDGSRQWRRYERWLEPILPILQPWIERYGYPA